MDILELQQRIEQWEDLHTEFQAWPIHADDMAASLVAFANTDSGQLILGVTNERHIEGVSDADRTMQMVDHEHSHYPIERTIPERQPLVCISGGNFKRFGPGFFEHAKGNVYSDNADSGQPPQPLAHVPRAAAGFQDP